MSEHPQSMAESDAIEAAAFEQPHELRFAAFEPHVAERRLRFGTLLARGTRNATSKIALYLTPVLVGVIPYWGIYGIDDRVLASPFFHRLSGLNLPYEVIDAMEYSIAMSVTFLVLLLIAPTWIIGHAMALRAARGGRERGGRLASPRSKHAGPANHPPSIHQSCAKPRKWNTSAVFGFLATILLGAIAPILGFIAITAFVVSIAPWQFQELVGLFAPLVLLLCLPRVIFAPFVLLDAPRIGITNLWRATFGISAGYHWSIFFVFLISLLACGVLTFAWAFVLEFALPMDTLNRWFDTLLATLFVILGLALWWGANVLAVLYTHRIDHERTLAMAVPAASS